LGVSPALSEKWYNASDRTNAEIGFSLINGKTRKFYVP